MIWWCNPSLPNRWVHCPCTIINGPFIQANFNHHLQYTPSSQLDIPLCSLLRFIHLFVYSFATMAALINTACGTFWEIKVQTAFTILLPNFLGRLSHFPDELYDQLVEFLRNFENIWLKTYQTYIIVGLTDNLCTEFFLWKIRHISPRSRGKTLELFSWLECAADYMVRVCSWLHG